MYFYDDEVIVPHVKVVNEKKWCFFRASFSDHFDLYVRDLEFVRSHHCDFVVLVLFVLLRLSRSL